jgi:bifunctional non-homologous end joining protein LigD
MEFIGQATARGRGRAGTMPTVTEPQLATAAKQIPAHGDWSYEIKFDGYRMMTRIEDGVVRFIT